MYNLGIRKLFPGFICPSVIKTGVRLFHSIKQPEHVFMAICCLALLLFTACGDKSGKKRLPCAERGVIDLRNLDFQRNGSVNLDGEWEFCPGRLYTPGDFAGNKTENSVFIKVPGMWKDITPGGNALPSKGEGTYRLKIICSPDEQKKVISLYRIYSAYSVWINGVHLCEKGMADSTSKSEKNYVYIHSKTTVPFVPENGINEIVLQVVNYDHESGGIGRPLELQNEETMLHDRFVRHTVEMIIVGLVLFFAISNLLLYFFRSDDKAALYSGLFCLFTAVNVFNLNIPILSGPLYWTRNPYIINFESVILIVFFNLMSLRTIFPDEFSTYILYFLQAMLLLFFAVLPFIDFGTSEKVMPVFFILSLFSLTYGLYILVKAIINRRDDAILFLTGFAPAYAGGINDALYALWIFKTTNLYHYGGTVLCIIVTFIVARRFSRTMQRLSDDLIVKNISLEKLDRIKDQLLANTSHELRTPLHGIIGLSETMLDGTAGSLSPVARENLSLIASSGHRLANMVNDLLDMARIQSRGFDLNIRSVDLFTLSETIVKLSLPLTGDRPVEIINSISPETPPVHADENRIKQVLHNLVGNAVKFTLKGKIELSAAVISPDECVDGRGFVEVSISDTGIGVPAEHRESIFEAYSQVDTGDTRSYSGTGLGLSIAKQIVELHGGTIKVIPGIGCGSVFIFSLPLAVNISGKKDAAAAAEGINDLPPESDPVYINSRTDGSINGFSGLNSVILIVDDDPVNVRMLKKLFESKNCMVKSAFDGINALEILERDDTIDLVLLDIMIPVISGYEVCRRIRIRRSPEELPVIMLTAKNMMSDIDAAFNAGANDYIVKPFRLSELLARSASMIKLRKVRKTAAASISIQSRGTVYTFTFDEIVYITSSAKNIIVHTVDADTVLNVMMKDMADRLPSDMFFRIHKSHIVNIRYISRLKHVISGRYRVYLCDVDNTELPVGPAFLESLRKKIQK